MLLRPLNTSDMLATAMPDAKQQKSLGTKLFLGVGAATMVSVPLSLGVTVIDRSVTQFANGSAPSLRAAVLNGAKTVLRTPHVAFIGRDNLAVFGVYGSTYVTKTAADISSKEYGMNPKWPMFFATIVVNGGLGIMKDRYLAQLFGSVSTPGPANPASYT